MEHHQLDLFTFTPTDGARPRSPTLSMDTDALKQWKSQLKAQQQHVRTCQPPQQTALFDIAPTHCDPNQIDPLTLRLVSMSFYRMPADGPGEACLYFVIDSAADIILYIGETCRSNKRWKGLHDCKRYIENYQSLHYQHGLKTAVNMTFWWDAPVQTRQRQQLELALILKWLPPFNKQNVDRWARPFG